MRPRCRRAPTSIAPGSDRATCSASSPPGRAASRAGAMPRWMRATIRTSRHRTRCANCCRACRLDANVAFQTTSQEETMRRYATLWAALLRLSPVGPAGAADIRVLSTMGVQTVVEELAPQFEQRTGHKLSITFGIANEMKRQIEGGETF